MSVCGENSSRINADPSRAKEIISFIPSRNLTSGSTIGRMLLSTSSALAPDQTTVTLMTLVSIVGKNWVLILVSDQMPAINIRTISKLAALGCRTKNETRLPLDDFITCIPGSIGKLVAGLQKRNHINYPAASYRFRLFCGPVHLFCLFPCPCLDQPLRHRISGHHRQVRLLHHSRQKF